MMLNQDRLTTRSFLAAHNAPHTNLGTVHAFAMSEGTGKVVGLANFRNEALVLAWPLVKALVSVLAWLLVKQ